MAGGSLGQGRALIVLDTSAIFALLNRKDPDHERVKKAFLEDRGPYLVPVAILAEITYLARRRLGYEALASFLKELEEGKLAPEYHPDDIARARELVSRYRDLPLSFADAMVIAAAERNGGRVLALDSDFKVVAREGTITVLP